MSELSDWLNEHPEYRKTAPKWVLDQVDKDAGRNPKNLEAPRIVPDGILYAPFMSEEKSALMSQGKWDEASKLPNYMFDCAGRLYIEVLKPESASE